MRKLRDVFYINADSSKNQIQYYGLEFKEFLQFVPVDLTKILLLESEYYGAGYRSKYRFEAVDESEIEDLISDNIYGYGNFTWVDYNDKDNIDKLTPREVAELLYLGHTHEPIDSPFLERINNRYAYLAHDDGWYCKIFCKYMDDFSEVIANKIVKMATNLKRRKIYPIDENIKSALLEFADAGLVIDFSNIMKFDKSIEVPIHVIGKFGDMDEMYNNLQRHIMKAKYSAKLVHKNKKWVIDYIIEK